VKAKRWKWRTAQWFEIRWWKNYLSKKNSVEYLRWKSDYWISFLRELNLNAESFRNQAVLDAGCGPAGIFMVLPHSRIEAVDPLMDEYRKNIPMFIPQNFPAVNFYSSPLEEFQPRGKYDAIFCLNVINHVQDMERCLLNFSQWLKPEGLLILSTDAHKYSAFRFLFQLLPGDVLHPHQYGFRDYQEMVKKAGFEPLQILKRKQDFFFQYVILKLAARKA
jgi:2-polyprenyl-6-hydroxyphenyl methylase/3-demethylubiquinone-9 3-methyltransferase